MTIRFTMRSRVMLTAKIRSLPPAKIDDEARLLDRDILLKIRPSQSDLKEITRALANGDEVMDIAAAELMDTLSVSLGDAEVRRLEKIIRNETWGREDDDWFQPLLDQIRDALSKKPTAMPKSAGA